VLDMPGWRPIVRRVATTLATVSLLPMSVFYASMLLFGLRTAALSAVGLCYIGLLLRRARGRPVLAAALVTAGLLSLRAVIMLGTGSALFYFLQPVAGTLAVATGWPTSSARSRPSCPHGFARRGSSPDSRSCGP
jgi:hypothetical protein